MTATKIDNIFVDAVKSATPSAPIRVSKYAIETGAQVADYVAEVDNLLTLEVYFADDRLVYRGPDDPLARAALNVTSAADKKKAVKRLKDLRKLVTIVMPDDRFTNMLLTDIQEARTKSNAKGFEATLVFEHIKTQLTGTAAVPLDSIKKKSPAKQLAAATQTPPTDAGKVEPVEVTDADEKARVKSLLAALGDAL